MRLITREELRDKLILGDAVTLVEALPEKYWRDSHLPGAIQMDYTEIADRAHKFLPDKEAKIVVYCASTECQNSSKAARTLEGLGYKNVHEYAQGKQHWLEAGLPVVGSIN
ncbi:MAG: rhodanese-like domain-containing protein [Thermodesulfobacteriota bacterium]|jgi:rhodanese-related sulfurtransferase|nr:rhodanese-like domain-containing protein [Candidatus Dadabacteria bacterium]MCZ6865304.1 rhodanese-like domain-containing protein [Candidatus Dadabacteria bacterium]